MDGRKDSLAEPCFMLIGEIFELRGMFKWVRRTLIALVQVTFGRTINKQIRDAVDWAVSEQMVVCYIGALRDALWPAGNLAPPNKIPSEEQSQETKRRAQQKLLENIPDMLQSLVGQQNARHGIIKIFNALQETRANKHLLYVDSLRHLLETGASVNAPPDPCEQSPVHLAAGGGLACFLLWQLQTGADLNQQDVYGEAPLHKAAKVGSMECLSLLVASDAQIDLCNKNGQTAEDLAWSCGFPECGKFLTTIKCMQTIKPSEQSNKDHCVPVLRQKRSFVSEEDTNGKRKC
uniref:Ankyrin repeat domain-containing protein 37 n=1 Tax=Balaenoptera musculus TaxID=9771 RepID=A0A8C0I6Q4_BALMU